MGKKIKHSAIIIACGLALLLVFSRLTSVGLAVDEEEAENAINQTERALGAAYTAVVEASNAGADISLLLTRLTEGGNYLSEAQTAFRQEDYEKAVSDSLECINAVSNVVEEATRLREEAKTAYNNRLLLTSAGSGVGLAIFIIAALLGWRYLKRKHTQKLLGMKPVLEETR